MEVLAESFDQEHKDIFLGDHADDHFAFRIPHYYPLNMTFYQLLAGIIKLVIALRLN
jgi:hypothetical protein